MIEENPRGGSSCVLQGCLFGAVALFAVLLIVMVYLAWARFRAHTAEPEVAAFEWGYLPPLLPAPLRVDFGQPTFEALRGESRPIPAPLMDVDLRVRPGLQGRNPRDSDSSPTPTA